MYSKKATPPHWINWVRNRPAHQHFMQAQADQHQQQGEPGGGAEHVFLAGGKTEARARN